MEAYGADQHLEDTWSDINSIDEDDSYIEIELDASPTCYNNDDDEDKSDLKGSCCTQYNDDDADDDDGGSKEYQLRISISSTISVSLEDDHEENLRNSTVPNMTAIEAPCMSPLMSISADDATARSFTDSQEIIMPLQHSSVVSQKIGEQGIEVEFSVQNQLCNTVPFNRRVGLESAQLDRQTTTLRATSVIPDDKVDVLYARARKQPNLTTTTTTTTRTTTINGGMMKLLIKFRGIKIGALLASVMKPLQPCRTNNGQKPGKKSKTFFQSKAFFQCYQKKLVNPTNGRCKNNMKRDRGRSRSYKKWDLEDDNSICSGSLRSSSKKSSSRVMEMDLGALGGIFNAMGMSIGHKGSGSKRSSSQSTSCDTTPIHEGFSLYSSENSNVQAAIAYCKSSLRQSSDFSF